MKICTEDPLIGHLDFKDDHVKLVTVAAAKALAELHGGTYECKALPDGWVGFRVSIDTDKVKVRADDRPYGPKSMIVSFEKKELNFINECELNSIDECLDHRRRIQ